MNVGGLSGCLEKLHDYQRLGVEWLTGNFEKKLGSLLADEMGLGKTVQAAIFILETFARHADSAKILVICPATLLLQWQEEIERCIIWCGDSECPLQPEMVKVLSSGAKATSKLFVQPSVVLASYEFVRLHIRAFHRHELTLCVLDEGHRIRNPKSQLTIALNSLKTKSPGARVLLTGTPLQNGLKEFWTLIDFIQPGLLGTLEVFSKYFIASIERAGRHEVTQTTRDQSRECIALLKMLIKPHILRRTKDKLIEQGVIRLPQKQEHVVRCALTYPQFEVYSLFLTMHNVQKAVAASLSYASAGRKRVRSQDLETQGKIFMYLSMLLKICGHPDILLRNEDPPLPDFGAVERCGKLKVLVELLLNWKANGHKALVFSQRIQTLNIIQGLLETLDRSPQLNEGEGATANVDDTAPPTDAPPPENKYLQLGRDFLRIDGNVPARNRLEMIDRFNASDSGLFCMLLTTRVGGVGINLTGADRVVLYDPDWNPSMDLQAQERCWRIGQTSQDVRVYRLVTKGTLEEKIYQRQIQKTHIASRILKNEDHKVFKANDFIEVFAHPAEPIRSEDTPVLSADLKSRFARVLKNLAVAAEDERGVASPKPMVAPVAKVRRGLPDGPALLLPSDSEGSDSEDPTKRHRIEGEGSEEGEITPDTSAAPSVGEDSLLDQLCGLGTIDSIADHAQVLEDSTVVALTQDPNSFAYRAYDAILACSRSARQEASRCSAVRQIPQLRSPGQHLSLRVTQISLSLKEQRLRDQLRAIIPPQLGERQRALFVKLCQMLLECPQGLAAAAVRANLLGNNASGETEAAVDRWLNDCLGELDRSSGRWRLRRTVHETIEHAQSEFESRYGIGTRSSAAPGPTEANEEEFF